MNKHDHLSFNMESPLMVTLSLIGEINYDSIRVFWKFFMRCVKKTKIIRLDLRGVPYIDSAGIATLIRMKRYLDFRNGQLILCSLPLFIHRVFKAASMDQFFLIE